MVALTLSVLMPSNKVDELFLSALRSIESDLPPDSEIVVVLNGPALSQAQEFPKSLKGNKNLRILKSFEQGIVPALNLGLSESRGTYVARMDADDENLPGRLKSQLIFLQEKPRYAAVGTQYVEVCEHGVQAANSHLPRRVTSFPMPPIRTRIAHPTVMFRKSEVVKVGGYRSDFPHVEDQDLWLRLLKDHRLGNLRQTFLKYRRHGGQISSLNTQEQSVGLIQAYLANSGLRASHSELLKASSADDFRRIIDSTIAVKRAVKVKLILCVEYWRFCGAVGQDVGKFVQKALRQPLFGLIFVWSNRRAITGYGARSKTSCDKCFS